MPEQRNETGLTLQCESRATFYDDVETTVVQCSLNSGHTEGHGLIGVDGQWVARWHEFEGARVWIGVGIPRRKYEFGDEGGS